MSEYVGKITKISGAAGFIRSTQGDISYNHATLLNRDAPNQHAIAAITGLQDELDSKAESADVDATVQRLRVDINEKADIDDVELTVYNLNNEIDEKGERLWFDEEAKLLYLIGKDDRVLGDGVAVASAGSGGGGGGTGGLNYTATLKAVGDRAFTVTENDTVEITFDYSSVDEDNMDDGPGICTIYSDRTLKRSMSVKQGRTTVDITSFLVSGGNNIIVRVENSEGVIKTVKYTITLVSLKITTNISPVDVYSGNAQFEYSISGAGDKIVHYVMDGNEIGSETVTSLNRNKTFIVPAQGHGVHIFECYATAEVNGVDVPSNVIRLSMIWIDSGNSTPIIASSFNMVKVMQGDPVAISYIAIDPINDPANITLSVIDEDGETYGTPIEITKSRDIGDPWVVTDYPIGNTTFRVSCRDVSMDFVVEVTAYELGVVKAEGAMALEFDPSGRTNLEQNPAQWSYGEGASKIDASFDGFSWYGADGWINDTDNVPVLRFLPGDTMSLPYYDFNTSNKILSGYTVEVEMATRDVRDYDTVVIDYMNSDTGFKITSQSALLASRNNKQVSMQFKEGAKVRVCFTIESTASNRFIRVYINGILCGIEQYDDRDTFIHPNKTMLTIGAESCGLDLYKIRCYDRALSDAEIVDNFIVDRSSFSERKDAFERNDIYNGDEISISKLPPDLPYVVLIAPKLPQYKGDKVKGVTIKFVDPSTPSKNFTAYNCTINVQGTSSQFYPVKNELLECPNGFEIGPDNNTVHSDGYAIYDGDIPTDTFCIKVDFASSENANNVVLVELYERICREQGWITPPQEENDSVRQGIAGRPIALFWREANDKEEVFIGKGNFNNDKSTPEVFGFEDGMESWEFLKNFLPHVEFRSNDFSSTSNWEDELECRYPGKTYKDTTRLKRLFDFVVAHNWDSADVKAEFGTRDAMLADFKSHFDEYFVRNNTLFYYLFTAQFIMMDSRAKNMFMTTFDGTHWMPIPYDFDTALGINNEGKLAYTFSLEDTDLFNGNDVFNGQKSVLWINVRDAFEDELKTMYRTLRNDVNGSFNYRTVKAMFTSHQSVWPERMWNEDASRKYVTPGITLVNQAMAIEDPTERQEALDEALKTQAEYNGMLQGDKSSQRDAFLYESFKYNDSKRKSGDAVKSSNQINFRAYGQRVGDDPLSITLTPYSDTYIHILYASASIDAKSKFSDHHRVYRDTPYVSELQYEVGTNDTEISIQSADRLSSVGDLSPLKIGTANFSAATKLKELIIGSSEAGYENPWIDSLILGNNELLTYLNICNCTALNSSIDLTNCLSIETVLATGTNLRSVTLPSGGHLKRLELPSTTTTLSILNQKNLQTLSVVDTEGDTDYSNILTLWIENTPNIPVADILQNMQGYGNVRLYNIDWTAESEQQLEDCIDKLDISKGIENGQLQTEVGTAVVYGSVSVSSISPELLTRIQNSYPNLTVVVNGVPQYTVRFMNYDNTVHYMQVVSKGGDATDPVATGLCNAPTKPATDEATYAYSGWSSIPTNVQSNISVIAVYDTTWRVRYKNWDGTVLQTKWVANGGTASYTGSAPTKPSDERYNYTFSAWSGSQSNITAPTDITATFTSSTRYYTVTFVNNNNNVLQTVNNVPYGGSASYTGSTPSHSSGSTDYVFTGFLPTGQNITGNTTCVAQYVDTSSAVLKYLRRDMTAYESDTATVIGEYAFYNMTTLASAETTATTIGQYAFNGCSNLTTVDLTATSGAVSIASNAFAECTKLTVLFIRSSSVATLAATNALPSTSFVVGNGAIYVPAGLVSSYKSATNWSTFADRIYPISAYPVTDFSTVSDTWEQIVAAGNDGSYKTKYSVGDTKLITNKNGNKYYAQLAAIEGDDLADNSGKAHMTWLLKNCYQTDHRMNATNTTTGGYPATEMRTWLTDTVLPTLPDTITGAIKEVTKTSYDYGTSSTLTSTEKLWIPSYREVMMGTDKEDSGVQYTGLFGTTTSTSSRDSRIKYSVFGSAYLWWLRSAYSSTYFYIVGIAGSSYYYDGASISNGVVFGFCI